MNSINIKLDLKLLCAVLLLVIIVMALFWQPWKSSDKRTITVSGEASVKASPDEFIFSPIYEKKAKDSTTAISEVSKVGNSVVAKLKKLGIPDKSITTNVTTQNGYEPLTGRATNTITAQFSLTVTMNDQVLAQKVLDYLVTTGPLYSVSPQSNFKKETRKQLESTARGKALADAKSKADQTAKELDVKIVRVVSVSEPQWGGPIMLNEGKAVPATIDSSTATPPVLLIGEQEVTYTVSVSFQIR